nr:histidine kinase [Nocardia panacis]
MTGRLLARDWGVALAVTAVVVLGGSFANRAQPDMHPLGLFGYLLLLVGPAALLWRRYQPVPVLWFAVGICLAYIMAGYGYGPIFLSLVVAFLTAATTGSRWWTYPVAPLGFLCLVFPLPVAMGYPPHWPMIFALAAWLSVLVLIAEGIRQRSAALLARRQRAEAAHRDEQAQRARRASEERLAIARELHDVLAHSLSLINVQSSVALELFDRKPEQAAAALATIKTTSKDALADVHTLLHSIRSGTGLAGAEYEPVQPVSDSEPGRYEDPSNTRIFGLFGRDIGAPERYSTVRQPEPPVRPAPRAPAPSIDDLDALLQRTRAAGLVVGTRVVGEARKLPSVIDVAASRIVQEALTNVVRHAPGAAATVTVRYTADSVDITVDNTRPTENPPRTGSGGNGILGMRERTHALGGALTAGPRPSGGFRVAARLPAYEPGSEAPPARPAPGPQREDRAADAVSVPPGVRPS